MNTYFDRISRKKFSPLLSLSKISLWTLKNIICPLPYDSAHIHALTEVDEIVYYSSQLQKRNPDEDMPEIQIDILDNAVEVYRRTYNRFPLLIRMLHTYWLPVYNVERERDALVLAVKEHLFKYVQAKALEDPPRIRRLSGPLLDLALRPEVLRGPNLTSSHSDVSAWSIDIDMVKTLLLHGADPNQPYQAEDRYSVWTSFVL
jgi:hypothetical protein